MMQPIERDAIYRRRRFPRETIEACVRWYLTYRLGYRDLVVLMAESDVHAMVYKNLVGLPNLRIQPGTASIMSLE